MSFFNNDPSEIDAFKTQISLVEFMAGEGYEIDESNSTRASIVMRRGDDKLILTTSADGHGMYWNVFDENDRGTIIDFVQNRMGLNLGQVRKLLRPWLGNVTTAVPQQYKRPVASAADRTIPTKTWIRAAPITTDPSYLISRKITNYTDPRFDGTIKTLSDGSVIFGHFDELGLTGYERKNAGFTGFSRGGEKRLWHSNNIMRASRIIVAETAIDALSHAQLYPEPSAAYASFGGSVSGEQLNYIDSFLNSLNAQVIVATDRDAAGDNFFKIFEKMVTRGLDRDLPCGKDFNDDLMVLAA